MNEIALAFEKDEKRKVVGEGGKREVREGEKQEPLCLSGKLAE